MCATCGCGTDVQHDHDHDHVHHDHHEHHDHAHHDHPKVVSLEAQLLAKNDRLAADNRALAGDAGGRRVQPDELARRRQDHAARAHPARSRRHRGIAVIEGDQETARDADRIRAAGARARPDQHRRRLPPRRGHGRQGAARSWRRRSGRCCSSRTSATWCAPRCSISASARAWSSPRSPKATTSRSSIRTCSAPPTWWSSTRSICSPYVAVRRRALLSRTRRSVNPARTAPPHLGDARRRPRRLVSLARRVTRGARRPRLPARAAPRARGRSSERRSRRWPVAARACVTSRASPARGVLATPPCCSPPARRWCGRAPTGRPRSPRCSSSPPARSWSGSASTCCAVRCRRR